MVEKTPVPTDSAIYFIPYLKSEIYRFDLDSEQLSLAISPKNITLGYGPHLCALSATKIFLQGGIINGEFMADSFAIDVLTGEIEEKAYGPINAAGACVLSGNCIFVFGGATRRILEPSPLSQVYNIKEDLWSQIANLPAASYNNTGIVKQDKFAIVGQHLSNLYYYDHSTDHYDISIGIEGLYKIITIWEEIIFIITVSHIKVLEGNEWKEYPHSTGASSYSYSYHVTRGNFIYMVTPPQDILRLNVQTKVLEKINTNLI